MSQFQKERKFQRHFCLVPVEAKPGTAFGSSQTVDISAGGLGLLVKKAPAVGKTIAIELEVDPSREPLVIKAKVKWVHKVSGSKFYRAGVSFREFNGLSGRNRLTEIFSVSP